MSIYTNVLQRIKKLKNFHENVQLAEYLGESKQSISNWIGGGKFNLDKVLDVCAKDGLDISYILTGDKPEPNTGESVEALKWQIRYEELEKRYNQLMESSRAKPTQERAELPSSQRRAG